MRILVIEDYDLLRESMVSGLREAGYAVDAAADGQEGRWYARSNPYDVIVLDLMLPRVDGLSILQELRRAEGPAPKDAAKAGTHVLILTAKDTTADRIKGLDAGADDYLVKPFDFGELLARVRALLRRSYRVKSPVVRVGDLELNTTTRSARRGGRAVELTAREYALLEFLAMRAGQVVTRTDIWEHVYEFNSDAQSNVVDVFIGHLRRKIELPGLPRLIHTRRGHGYVLGEKDPAGGDA